MTETEKKMLSVIDKLRREKVFLRDENSILKHLITTIKAHAMGCNDGNIQPIEILDIISSYNNYEEEDE